MTSQKSPEFTVGSDPEMVFLTKEDGLVKAGDVLVKKDKFGVDGHAFIAELRPDAAVSPRTLVMNLAKLFKTKSQKLDKYKWVSGPWVKGKPLGGHIHFGIPLQDGFIDALDNLLGCTLALVEPQVEARERRTVVFYGDRPYGMLSDVREKPWGFEYRTPSSFIVNPGVSLGIMALSKAIIHEELIKSQAAWTHLPPKMRGAIKFKKADFYECNKEIFIPKINDLLKIFRAMRYFSKGHEGEQSWSTVSYLFNTVVKKNGYQSDRDIKLSWRLLPENHEVKSRVTDPNPVLVGEDAFPEPLEHRIPTVDELIALINNNLGI